MMDGSPTSNSSISTVRPPRRRSLSTKRDPSSCFCPRLTATAPVYPLIPHELWTGFTLTARIVKQVFIKPPCMLLQPPANPYPQDHRRPLFQSLCLTPRKKTFYLYSLWFGGIGVFAAASSDRNCASYFDNDPYRSSLFLLVETPPPKSLELSTKSETILRSLLSALKMWTTSIYLPPVTHTPWVAAKKGRE